MAFFAAENDIDLLFLSSLSAVTRCATAIKLTESVAATGARQRRAGPTGACRTSSSSPRPRRSPDPTLPVRQKKDVFYRSAAVRASVEITWRPESTPRGATCDARRLCASHVTGRHRQETVNCPRKAGCAHLAYATFGNLTAWELTFPDLFSIVRIFECLFIVSVQSGDRYCPFGGVRATFTTLAMIASHAASPAPFQPQVTDSREVHSETILVSQLGTVD